MVSLIQRGHAALLMADGSWEWRQLDAMER